jgi:MATE family multidrug resistance protein
MSENNIDSTRVLSERSPLLPVNTSLSKDIPCSESITYSDYFNQCLQLFRLSVPVILSFVIQRLITFSSIFFIGQYLGKTELAAASLSNMFAAITGWSLAQSMAGVLDALCSQAFTGATDVHLVGVYLQRGILITSAMFIPIGYVWYRAEYLLLLLDLDPLLCKLSGQFLQILIFGAVPFVVFECIKKYMFAQGIVKAPTYIVMVVIPFHIFFNYILVANPATSIGFIGAPLSTVFSFWMMLILSLIYCCFFEGYKAWGGWSRKALEGWGVFIKMGIPNIIMACAEWWAFEILALGASYLGIVPLASFSVLISVSNVYYFVYHGIAVIASNAVGNCIGDAMPNRGAFVVRCSLIISVMFAIFNTWSLLYFSRELAGIFTNDEEVLELSASLLPYVASYQIFDSLTTVASGIVRGQGRPNVGAIVNFVFYYGISIPVGFGLAFKADCGIYGLYYGIIATLLCTGTCMSAVVLKSDWIKLVSDCQSRLSNESQSHI